MTYLKRDIQYKNCSKCLKNKPLHEFHKNSSKPSGRQDRCKICCKEYKKEYYAKNTEKVNRRNRVYNMSNPEVVNRAREKYLKNNKVKVKINRELWIENHKEQIKANKLLSNAIRDKRIKPSLCIICNKKAEGHHYDYSKPLSVIWLCKKHHMQHHIVLNAIAKLEA